MNDTKDEFASLAHQVRYYKRQSRLSWIAFAVAAALFVLALGKMLEYRNSLSIVQQMYLETEQALMSSQGEGATMRHYILTLQGRLNGCRTEAGHAEIKWEKY